MKFRYIILFLALVLIIGNVNGYVWTFSDRDVSDFVEGLSGLPTHAEYYPNSDQPSMTSDLGFKSTISYPTNYWAFTALKTASYQIGYYDISGVHMTDSNLFACNQYDRVEVYRSVPNITVYRNGVYETGYTLGTTIPYYFLIGQNSMVGAVDDVVFGTSEERDVIGTINPDWFVAKDIFDPGFSGLYSAPNTQISGSLMHTSYASDDGNMTVVMTGPDGNIYNTTSISSSYAGIITYNLTDTLFTPSAPYGLYTISSSGHDAFETFWYTGIATSGTSILWNSSSYLEDETALITYSIAIAHWDTANYKYYYKIEAGDLSDMISTEITTQPTNSTYSFVVEPDVIPVDGTYYCTLYAVDRSSGEEILLTFDDAYFDMSTTGDVIVQGVTYDATTDSALGTCVVTATQMGSPNTDTSNSIDGSYTITGLTTEFSIGVNATKTSYVGFPTYFTPYESGTYIVDIPLIPSDGATPGAWYDVEGGQITYIGSSSNTTSYYNATTNGTALGGLCYYGPYWDIGEGCNVTLSNATWNSTVTTGNGGWYEFENLDSASTYTISCNSTGYYDITDSCSLTADCFNRKDCYLDGDFTLTVYVKDLDYLTFLTDSSCTVTVESDPMTSTCTGGVATFNHVEYGVHTITGTCDGYYPGSSEVVVDDTESCTVYCQERSETASASGGAGIAYAPHQVRFVCRAITGEPIEDVMVNATYVESSSPLDTLLLWLGINSTVSSSDIATAELGGYTGKDGAISFMMLESVKYNVTAFKAGVIDANMVVYPHETEYVLWAESLDGTSWYEYDYDPLEIVNVSVGGDEINATYGWMNVTYVDSLSETASVWLLVNQSHVNGSETTYTQQNIASSSWYRNLSISGHRGNSYRVHLEANNSRFGNITRDYGVKYRSGPLTFGLPEALLMYIGMAALIFIGLIIPESQRAPGTIILCFWGWIFYAMGWWNNLATSTVVIAALTLMTFVAVLFNIMVRSKKVIYT